MGGVRFCYNRLVAEHRKVGQGGINLASMRDVIKRAHEEHSWLGDIPCEIKDVAVRDMDKARKAHFAKQTKDKNAQFKFRSRKDIQQSFEVRARDMIRHRGLFAFLRLDKLRAAEPLPSELECAVRFVRDRLGKYFIVVVMEYEVKGSETQAPIVALDPGVRTFQTTYDTRGLATEWGKGDMKRIYALCRCADKTQSSMAHKSGSKRRGAEHAWWRILNKIKFKVGEIHHKLAVWLCENYTSILIPKFESSTMVKKGRRKISSKTSRSMLTWSHYRFREILKTKAELHHNVEVIECSEAFTSKTCGCCGELNVKLGSSKVFRCGKCGYEADRDINGARNILLRHLTLA